MLDRSLTRAISMFFVLVLILINIAFVLLSREWDHHHERHRVHRFIAAMFDLSQKRPDGATRLAELHVALVPLPAARIMHDGQRIAGDPWMGLYRFEGEIYALGSPPSKPFVPRPPERGDRFLPPPPPLDMRPFVPDAKTIVLKDTESEFQGGLWLLAAAVNGVLIAFFLLIRRKLAPLKRLKEAIVRLRRGDESIEIPVEGDDEIADVARELDHTIVALGRMKAARTLFLRNILHELKTPIMKGKLIADMGDDAIVRERLRRVFERLELLLGEFAKVERFAGSDQPLQRTTYRMIDILDHAKDLLMLDNPLVSVTGEEGMTVDADFELFATALKNLIDNGLKYGMGSVEIRLGSKMIEVRNPGEPIFESKLDFTKPFNRPFEDSSRGLGLGLYIANAIFERHGWRMAYRYEEGISVMAVIPAAER